MKLDKVQRSFRCSRAALIGQRWRSSMPAVEPSEPQLPPFDHTPAPYQGPSKEEVHALRKQYLSPALFHHFKDPIMITEGKMQYLYDDKGRRYLDAFAGIVTVSVGHCHPKVVDAVKRQSELLQHTTTIYLNPQIALYAKELTDRLPGNLKVAYFVNSGSEANDMAMLMARLYTGNYDMLALRNCYHGMSEGTMGVTAHSTWKFSVPQGFGIRHTLNPNPYTGAFGNDGKKYAEDVQDVIRTCTPGGVAGFIAETIQGVGGSVPLADGYLPAAYEMVREAGGVCIADEVQTGFGRTGTNYWGFQNQGVVPDIVTMAKGIGNGLPLAAVVTTPEIAQTLAQRLHFNTYGGNPVCCAGGRAVLQAVDEDGIQANAAKVVPLYRTIPACPVWEDYRGTAERDVQVGDLLLERIRALQQKHNIIGDVRGQGLMLGVEMVKDQASKEPAAAETAQPAVQLAHKAALYIIKQDPPHIWHAMSREQDVMQRLRELGVLIGKGGLHGNVFRIKPPMCITTDDAEFLTEAFDLALSEL